MAADVLCGGGFLEYVGCGCVWLHGQSAHLAVLHPGLEHYSRPCPCGLVRCVWLPGHRLYPVGAALRRSGLQLQLEAPDYRSEKRRVGEEVVRTWRYRGCA